LFLFNAALGQDAALGLDFFGVSAWELLLLSCCCRAAAATAAELLLLLLLLLLPEPILSCARSSAWQLRLVFFFACASCIVL
jgi:hypothetical protein